MKNEKWKTKNEKQKMKNEKQKMKNEKRETKAGGSRFLIEGVPGSKTYSSKVVRITQWPNVGQFGT